MHIVLRWLLVSLAFGSASSPFFSPASADDWDLYELSQRHMGTIFKIALYAPDEASARRAGEAAFDRIAQLDKTMSDYDEESELSRLSAASPTKTPVIITDDLFRVLRRSQEISALTNGTFDITVGPLTRLWRRSRRQKELPTSERLTEARSAVGYQHLRLHSAPPSAELLQPQMRLDLGGIGQGFAADEALRLLKQLGFPQALIDASGDLAIGDPPPNKLGWHVAVAPLEQNAPPSQHLTLANCAISTSGDAFQFVEIGGKRFSHIVDPSTGLGLTKRCSVTIIAPDCTTADALATAVCVLGPQRGFEVVEKVPRTAALFVSAQDQKVETSFSHRWKELGK